MPSTQPPGGATEGAPDDAGATVAVGVQAVYDAIAGGYDAELGAELDGKPLDRALLEGFVELAGPGTIVDVGCGPGHITRFVAARHTSVIGVDLSPGMIAVAHRRAPELPFVVGSMLRLPVADGACTGVLAMYSIIHLAADERAVACREFARSLRPGGWLLLAFHIDSPDFAAGQVNHLEHWFGRPVRLDGHFIEPAEMIDHVAAAGFEVMSNTIRQPWPDIEYPSRRCYLLARRR